MSDLISMKRRDGSEKKLEIIRWITSHTSTKCDDFVHKLLNDRLTMRELRKKCGKDDDAFVRAVLDKWVSRDDNSKEGSLPCTWDTLVQCVDESGLDGDFLKLLKDNVPTGMCTSVWCVYMCAYITTCMHTYMYIGAPIAPESPSPTPTKKSKCEIIIHNSTQVCTCAVYYKVI